MDKTERIPRITVPPKKNEESTVPSDDLRHSEGTVRIEPVSSHHDALPTASEFSVIKKIGDGGMGIVYLAKEQKLGRFVAIKRLKKSMSRHPMLLKRFFREAKAIAALGHNHIVHVYALDQDKEGPYIAMEYVEGPRGKSSSNEPAPPFTLADLVFDDGPLAINRALDLCIKLCHAIGYAHTCGVIHRDLKPANVLLDRSNEPKIVDFGLARRLDPDEDQLTVPGEKMLSMGYGAPEQEEGEAVIDERADIYGLGAILFFSITGQNPRYFRPNSVPELLREVLTKALETDRDKRWSTVKEFESQLTMISAPSSIDIPTTRVTWRCKWCNVTNPVSVKYCGDCGWDGSELCQECGVETRVGIQFCGNCGADAREYEMASLLLNRLRRHFDRKDFAYILQHAGQISGFQPVGPSGQKLIDEIYELRRRSDRNIHRLEELSRQIPREIKGENFLLARKHIEEYNALAQDAAFSQEIVNLPDLTVHRELDRARKALESHDWDYASHIAREIRMNLQPGSHDAAMILRSARLLPWWIALRNMSVATGIAFLLYIFSAPVTFRAMGKPAEDSAFHAFYGFAILIHDGTFMRKPMDKYAALFGSSTMYRTDIDKPETTEPIIPSAPPGQETDGRLAMVTAYKKSLLKLEADHKRNERSWPSDYISALSKLQEQLQRDGDFDGWLSAKTELERFETEFELSEGDIIEQPAALKNLQRKHISQFGKSIMDKHQKVLLLTTRCIQELGVLQKRLTKQGKMNEAALINQDLKRIKEGAEYLAAETAIRKEQERRAERHNQARP